MILKRQSTNYSCAAASLAMLMDCSEEKAAFLAKTTFNGTSPVNVSNALKKEGFPCKFIEVNLPYECVFAHLKLLSNQYKIFVSGSFSNRYGKPRQHAFCIKDAQIFDPSQSQVLDMDSINHLYHKKLGIKSIILVGIEDEKNH